MFSLSSNQSIRGQMAERSKALASGASREICVGSNPTLFTILFALLRSSIAVVVVEISQVG